MIKRRRGESSEGTRKEVGKEEMREKEIEHRRSKS